VSDRFSLRGSRLIQGMKVGRPYVYGLIIGGEAGVEQVVRQTLADLDVTLGLSGYRSLSEIYGKGEEVVVKIDL
jgi:lactate 2-monooxygenase